MSIILLIVGLIGFLIIMWALYKIAVRGMGKEDKPEEWEK